MLKKLFQFMKLKSQNFLGTMEISIEEYTRLKIAYMFRYLIYTACFLFGFMLGGMIMGIILIAWFK
jgi:hypothetical protein